VDENKNEAIFHIPVLVEQVLEFLLTNPSGIYVDGMMGGGGHAAAVLERLNRNGRIIGIDRDEYAVLKCREIFSNEKSRVKIVRGDFGSIDSILSDLGITKIDGLFLDLGISSYQVDTTDRGFSYLTDGPLDMRMDTDSPKSAADVVNSYSEKLLREILKKYGEEKNSYKIAKEIVRAREKKKIETTKSLAEIVMRVTPPRWRIKTLSRVFQAIRIEVNDEHEQLRHGLEMVYPLLKMNGRIVVISYESQSDRLVKRYFRGENPSFMRRDSSYIKTAYCFKILTRRVVRPSEEEVDRNPRARSAKLRAAEKCRCEA